MTNFPDYEGKIRYSRNQYVTRIKGGFTFAVVGYLSFHNKENSSILLLNKFKFRLPSFPQQFRWRGKTGRGGGEGGVAKLLLLLVTHDSTTLTPAEID